MLRTGLSGGIGSGKSTVSARLAEHGAVVIDADRVAREVVQPGTPGLAQVSERFGPQVLADDGSLDRPALGALVFAEPIYCALVAGKLRIALADHRRIPHKGIIPVQSDGETAEHRP